MWSYLVDPIMWAYIILVPAAYGLAGDDVEKGKIRAIILTFIYVLGEAVIENEPKMVLMLGIITNCLYACWSESEKSQEEME